VPDRSRRPGLADDAIGGAGPQRPQPGELGNVPPCHWVRVLLPPVPAGAVGIEAVGHLLPDAGIIGAEAVGAQLGLTSGAFGIVWSAFGSLNFPNGKNVLHAAGMLSIQALTFGSIVKVGLSVGQAVDHAVGQAVGLSVGHAIGPGAVGAGPVTAEAAGEGVLDEVFGSGAVAGEQVRVTHQRGPSGTDEGVQCLLPRRHGVASCFRSSVRVSLLRR